MADLIISQPMTFTVDVKTGLVERPQRESLMRGDKYANRIIVELVDGSEPFDITGVTVKGEFCKPPNGDSINLSGEAKDNVAEVQLTDQCYTAGGHYEARVILVLDEVERTVLFISGDVLKSGSGNAAGDEPGSTGSGLPAGGTAGQVLFKVSSAQGDAIWKTLTASDVGALPSGGTAKNSEKLGGQLPEYYAKQETVSQLSQQMVDYRTAVNLLDNSDWRIKKNIVNQSGQDKYVGIAGRDVYTIDRWVIPWQEGLVLTVGDGYLQKGNKLFVQRLPDSIDPTKTYTGALCLLDGTMFVYSGTPENGFGGWSESFFIGKDGGRYSFMIMDQMTQPMAWAALYEGEYTADNLPPYRPKGYANELLACEVAENGDVFSGLRQQVSDAWNSHTLYTVGDYCIYDNTLYRRKINASGAESAFVPEYWQAVTVANELKNRKEIKTKQVTATTDSDGFIQLISTHDAECVLQAKTINLNGFCFLYTHFFDGWFTAKCTDWDGTVYANAQVTIVFYYI